MSGKIVFTIYNTSDAGSGEYYKKEKLFSKSISQGNIEMSLVPGVYLFAMKIGNKEYGAVAEVGRELKNVEIKVSQASEVIEGKKYKSDSSSLSDKLKGHILLQVEANGEAWYVNMDSKKRYYMKNGHSAYSMMREFGLGITNENLKKIAVGLNDRFEESDYDGDGLPDKLEEALGTDYKNPDTDGDGFKDGEEVRNGYNPLGPGKINIDNAMVNKLKGRILLQVESKGEAWYISPADGKRYYMKDGESAYQIMRFLSLGITNENLGKIGVGNMN
jgi:hypothetical protein